MNPFDQFDTAESNPFDQFDKPADMPAKPVGKGEAFVAGLRKPLDAAAAMLVHALPESVVNAANKTLGDELAPTAPQLDATIKARLQDYAARRAAAGQTGLDIWNIAGNMAGIAPLAPLLPEATTLGGAAVGGAATGLLDPDVGEGSFLGNKAKQAGVGTITGVVAYPVTKALGGLISPKPSSEIKALQDAGVSPTIGQILGGGFKRAEEKLTSIPGLGDLIASGQKRSVDDFNRAIYNKALESIGETYEGKVGHEGIKSVGDRLSAAYENLLPGLTFTADNTLNTELGTLKTLAQSQYTPDKVKNVLVPTIDDITGRALAPNGIMSGESYKELESKLAKEIATYGKSAEPENIKIKEGLQTILKSLRDNLVRTNPDQAATLKDINRGWAMLVRLETAGGRVGAKDGVFTPNQFLSAVAQTGKGVRGRNLARGEAMMQDIAEAGRKVLGDKYPDSGTAGRLALATLGGVGAGEAAAHPDFVADHPFLTGAAVLAAGAYTPLGQRGISKLLSANRPLQSPLLGDVVRKSTLPLSAAGYSLLGSP